MRRLATVLSAMASIGAVAALAYLLTMPAYEGLVASTSSAITGNSGSVALGGSDAVGFTRTLAEENGSRIWVILLVVTLSATLPLAVALIRPTAQRTTTWTAALFLSAFSVLAGFSIGLFFMPSALILLAAAVATLFVRGSADRELSRSGEVVRAGSPR